MIADDNLILQREDLCWVCSVFVLYLTLKINTDNRVCVQVALMHDVHVHDCILTGCYHINYDQNSDELYHHYPGILAKMYCTCNVKVEVQSIYGQYA